MPIESADTRFAKLANNIGIPPDQMALASLQPEMWPHKPGLIVPADTGTYGGSLPAICNNGRWLVQCPTCNSAQFTAKADRRFFCGECSNSGFGGMWVTVTWPDDPTVIETLLEARPNPVNQNWVPVLPDGTTITVETLVTENLANGIPVPTELVLVAVDVPVVESAPIPEPVVTPPIVEGG